MKEAKIFGEKSIDCLVKAEDIKNGLISKNHQFVDPEYEFKVIYVSGAKNNGEAHFRLYLSKEDYNRLTPDRKSKYEILRKQRHYDESHWHKEWEEKFKSFAVIEKHIKDVETNQYKRADVYYEKAKVVVEVQHSYIDNEFVNRNEFYSKLSLETIWLFDLTNANVEIDGDNLVLVEDNSNGFFRVCEECNELSKYYVYIQMKNNMIYRVKSLKRKLINNDLKSTIRYFEKSEVYTVDQFVEMIKMFHVSRKQIEFEYERICKIKSLFQIYKEENISEYGLQLTVYNHSTKKIIKVFKDVKTGRLCEDYKNGGISYLYCSLINGKYVPNKSHFYNLKKQYAYANEWELIETIRK